MRAIVLAAGKGSRLKGTTRHVPKPMIELDGKPILASNIEWLRSYGVTDLTLNLHYLPERIRDYFGDGEAYGVSIRYSHEKELLGTAGAVARIADCVWGDVAEPFFVIYGDNRLTYDLAAIKSFHAQRDACGTICVYEKVDVSQSGIVAVESDGRITQFIEKPAPDQVISHLVNTGIYLLDPTALPYIERGTALDFGRDVFPLMLQANAPLYATQVSGSLTAIDTPALLAQAQDKQAEQPRGPDS